MVKEMQEPLLDRIDVETPPRCIGNYEVSEILGEGAYGKVFLAKDTDGSEVALKEVYVKQEDQLQDLCQEVILLQSVDHPSIVKCMDSFNVGQKLIIVMEYCPGISLQIFLESGIAKKKWGPDSSMSEPICWEIFLQLALALRYLHVDKNITHRDLSANNVLLMPQTLCVKLADFGLAKQTTMTEHMRSVVGTLLYSCPEIVQHQPYTQKADIWALGCLLYKMATLEDPFSGTNALAVARRIVECDYKELDESHSPLRQKITKACFTVDPNIRPNISQILELLTPVFVLHLEKKWKDDYQKIYPEQRTTGLSGQRKMIVRKEAMQEKGMDPIDLVLDLIVMISKYIQNSNEDPKVATFYDYFMKLSREKRKVEMLKVIHQVQEPLPCFPSDTYAELYAEIYSSCQAPG